MEQKQPPKPRKGSGPRMPSLRVHKQSQRGYDATKGDPKGDKNLRGVLRSELIPGHGTLDSDGPDTPTYGHDDPPLHSNVFKMIEEIIRGLQKRKPKHVLGPVQASACHLGWGPKSWKDEDCVGNSAAWLCKLLRVDVFAFKGSINFEDGDVNDHDKARPIADPDTGDIIGFDYPLAKPVVLKPPSEGNGKDVQVYIP